MIDSTRDRFYCMLDEMQCLTRFSIGRLCADKEYRFFVSGLLTVRLEEWIQVCRDIQDVLGW